MLTFVFIGAGSGVFTLRLFYDLLKEADLLDQAQFRLVDINPVKLERVSRAVRMMLTSMGRDFEVTCHSDYKEALPGADFVFLTYLVGTQGAWIRDMEICTEHGVNHHIGHTYGPAGISPALRNIPVAIDIAREMEKVCPDAWIINHTNPEGAMCLALLKYTKIKTFGLCGGTPGVVERLAREVFGVEPDRMTYRAAGINHLTWITELRMDGEDVYPRLREEIVRSGFDKKEPISVFMYDTFGLYPTPSDDHVKEFFPFYLKDHIFDFNWLRNLRYANAEKRLDKVLSGEMGFDEVGDTTEKTSRFIRALTGKCIIREMINGLNRGYIENISDDILVEISTFVDAFGLHPQKIGRLPDGIAAKCEAMGRENQLIVNAAVNCDRKAALQAMMLDPLAANGRDPKKLLDELLEAQREWLPAGWFE